MATDPTTWKGVVVRLLGDQGCRKDLLSALPQVALLVGGVVVVLAVAVIVVAQHWSWVATATTAAVGGGLTVGATTFSAIRRRPAARPRTGTTRRAGKR